MKNAQRTLNTETKEWKSQCFVKHDNWETRFNYGCWLIQRHTKIKTLRKKSEKEKEKRTKIEFRLKIARHNNRDLNYYMRFRFYDHVGQRGMVGNYVTSAGVIKCHKETDQPIRLYFFVENGKKGHKVRFHMETNVHRFVSVNRRPTVIHTCGINSQHRRYTLVPLEGKCL